MTRTFHRAPRIPVPGTFNFRDLGGHSTVDGRRVSEGRLYRADGLGRLGPDGVAMLKEMRIVSVVDLRE
ncbi:MAG TPA: tyrosine-protein phosphatase, partial [Brevibacterium sp.]|nr:tyrosine-protein phosphatase [Brevibacterium sp.]